MADSTVCRGTDLYNSRWPKTKMDCQQQEQNETWQNEEYPIHYYYFFYYMGQ